MENKTYSQTSGFLGSNVMSVPKPKQNKQNQTEHSEDRHYLF